MTVINTNVASLKTQAALTSNSHGLSRAMEQLSTGKRINSADDDAAGMALATSFGARVASLNQAVRNSNDGISLIQTADAAMQQIGDILQRMRELATQWSNGTYSSDDVDNIQIESQALADEIDRITTDTTWNDITLLNGASITIQLEDSTVDVELDDVSDLGMEDTSDVTAIDDALTTLAAARAKAGSYVNRFQYTVDNLTSVSVHLAESKSRIEDADYGEASSALAKHQVIQQAATAMLAQANQQPQSVLTLLK